MKSCEIDFPLVGSSVGYSRCTRRKIEVGLFDLNSGGVAIFGTRTHMPGTEAQKKHMGQRVTFALSSKGLWDK